MAVPFSGSSRLGRLRTDFFTSGSSRLGRLRTDLLDPSANRRRQ